MNFVKYALNVGGSIHPLILPIQELQGPSLTNPSVYNDDGRILVNLRNINYTLYHAEKNKYENQWGPLVYIHPENDMHLRTWNYLCELDGNLRISKYFKIDTTDFPDQELWEFVGLEDCRIIRWNQKLYVSGVRRDLDSTGIGRMELCEIQDIKQVSQFRIPTPVDKNSYCEKNWMPITDMPYHYVKWTNGTEVVKVNPETQTCEQVKLHTWKDLGCGDLRGGSQVIPFGDYRICVVHETFLYNSEAGRKDGTYRHRFIVWDKDWNIVKVSPQFSFMEAKIEFCCGLTSYENDFLLTFGFQDNASYLLKVPQDVVRNFIG
jgi:hypothetical protein